MEEADSFALLRNDNESAKTKYGGSSPFAALRGRFETAVVRLGEKGSSTR
jgi:hypothetical protein